MFNRPAFVQPGSFTDGFMTKMESAFAAGDQQGVEAGFHHFLRNMGGHGASGTSYDNAITDYLEQFEGLFA